MDETSDLPQVAVPDREDVPDRYTERSHWLWWDADENRPHKPLTKDGYGGTARIPVLTDTPPFPEPLLKFHWSNGSIPCRLACVRIKFVTTPRREISSKTEITASNSTFNSYR